MSVACDRTLIELANNCISSIYPIEIGPASIDFHLDGRFVYSGRITPEETQKYVGNDSGIWTLDSIVLNPGDFILAQSEEYIRVPNNYVVRCEGRSSIGRLGITVHVTAGYIDPGFEGRVTLEIANLNRVPVELKTGMKIGQFVFESLDEPCEENYSVKGNYQYQLLPTCSKLNYLIQG